MVYSADSVDRECSICLQPFGEGQLVSCEQGHKTHRSCINAWRAVSKAIGNCPICRSSLLDSERGSRSDRAWRNISLSRIEEEIRPMLDSPRLQRLEEGMIRATLPRSQNVERDRSIERRRRAMEFANERRACFITTAVLVHLVGALVLGLFCSDYCPRSVKKVSDEFGVILGFASAFACLPVYGYMSQSSSDS